MTSLIYPDLLHSPAPSQPKLLSVALCANSAPLIEDACRYLLGQMHSPAHATAEATYAAVNIEPRADRRCEMPLFISIGYGDEQGYQSTPAAVRDAAHAHDQKLRDGGAVMGIAGAPAQVRNHGDAGVVVTHGAFMESALPIAGFAVLEAASLDDAIRLVEKSPCAVAHGVVEVWPLQQPGSGPNTSSPPPVR